MAHKDFDQERSQRWQADLVSFRIGGEEFTVRPVVPIEALVKYDEMDATTLTNLEAMAVLDEVIEAVILPGQAERWHAARERKLEDMIGPDATRDEVIEASRQCIALADVLDVVPWLVEEVTGRPLKLPGTSSPSPDTNGTGSTGDSPSEESTPPPSTPAAS